MNSKKTSTTVKLDKTALSTSPLFEEEEEKAYWFSRSTQERLQHIERLRRINYGNSATARLQRILEIVEQTWR